MSAIVFRQTAPDVARFSPHTTEWRRSFENRRSIWESKQSLNAFSPSPENAEVKLDLVLSRSGLVVSMFTFKCEKQSLNPTKVYSFYSVNCL